MEGLSRSMQQFYQQIYQQMQLMSVEQEMTDVMELSGVGIYKNFIYHHSWRSMTV